MPKMRTIDETIAHIKGQDGETALTKTALRRLVITGVIPCVRVGQKYLLDLDRVESFLTAGTTETPAPSGVIRRVS